MQVLLYRTHLRRGAQRFCVKSLLYIPPERSSGPKRPLGQVDSTQFMQLCTSHDESERASCSPNRSLFGVARWRLGNFITLQVWWYYTGLFMGRLAVHNVATSETKLIAVSQQMPAVMVMAQVCGSLPCLSVGCLAIPAADVAFYRVRQRVVAVLKRLRSRTSMCLPCGNAGYPWQCVDWPQGWLCQIVERVVPQPRVSTLQGYALRHQVKGRATLGDLVISTHLLQTRLLWYPAVNSDLITFGGIADLEG